VTKRIAVCSPIVQAEMLDALRTIPGLECISCTPHELPAHANQVDALVLAAFHYTPALAASLAAPSSHCRWIQLLTAGYETLEEIGIADGIQISNAGNVWSPCVAEHAMALLLGLARRFRRIETAQRAAEWDNHIRNDMLSLYGSRLLIVGMGHIGREVAKRARAFGMTVSGVSRFGRVDGQADVMYAASQLTEAIRAADAIVLAVPSSAATHHLFGREELAACSPQTLIVNVARGNVIDPDALADALEHNRIGGAALDVTEPEPLPTDSPLWRLPNVIISPHLGGAAPAGYYRRLVDHVARNAAAFAIGAPVQTITVTWQFSAE